VHPCLFKWCEPGGFRVNICPDSGGTITSPFGTIATGPYGNSWLCVWTIAPENASMVTLTFSEFLTEGPASGTVGDWAYVWECADPTCASPTLLGSFAGTLAVIPPSLSSTTGVMRVQVIRLLPFPSSNPSETGNIRRLRSRHSNECQSFTIT
jgi:hypothetical protein